MEADEAMMRLAEILDQNPLPEPAKTGEPLSSEVIFDHVLSAIRGMEHPALDDVSFTVKPGMIVGSGGTFRGWKIHSRGYDSEILGCPEWFCKNWRGGCASDEQPPI